MKHLNDEQLNERIDSFLARKHQQYPELSLRKNEKQPESMGYFVVDKFTEFISGRHIFKLAH